MRIVAFVMALHCLYVACATRGSADAPSARPVAWSVFIDDLHLDFRNTGRLRDALRRLTNELAREGDTLELMSSGPSNIDSGPIAIDSSSNRPIVASTIRKFAGNGLRPSDFLDHLDDPHVLGEIRYRAGVALTAANRAIARLAERSRRQYPRKAFVYLSNGYYVESPFAHRDGLIGQRRDALRTITVQPFRRSRAEFARAARRGRIRVFVIDARVLAPGVDLDAVDPAWPNHEDVAQSSLRSLAADARGLALTRADMAKGFRQIADEMRR